MNTAPQASSSGTLPEGEAGRLTALAAYEVAGAEPGADLDHVVYLAAELLQVPIALISLVGHDRQSFTARLGLEADGTSRDVSFCSHTIGTDGVFVVPDAATDTRFMHNPLVTGDPGIRFYAGAPLISPLGGHRVGALCVIDRSPRPSLGEREMRLLSGLAALVVDRMELRRLEAERRASLERFERMAAATPNAVVCADAGGHIRYWNLAAERLLGWTAEEALDQPLTMVVPERLRAEYAAAFPSVGTMSEESSAGQTLELMALRRDGSELPAEVTLSCWREDDGRPAFGSVIRDITDRRQAEERLRRLAHFDSVTGLANRAALSEALDRAVKRTASVALVLLNLDGFKHVNDALGHGAGNALLREVAERLKQRLGGRGTLARLGGDEFAAVLSGAGGPAAVETVAQELQACLAVKPFLLGERVFHIAASTGLAVAPAQGAGMLLPDADLALHHAKATGGGACRTFTSDMRADYEAQRRLEEEVRRAAENGEFVLHYQPQVRLADGVLVGVEALLRWQHPKRGLLAPAGFLAALEAGPFASVVGDWAIGEACRQAATWHAAGQRLRVGVNLFAEQLRRSELERTVERALIRYGLPSGALELEITETIALHHDHGSLEPLRRLHAGGVGIAFDDFGTGYASLSTLKRFPLTRLKIDRSFVTNLGADAHDAAIVEAVLALARGLELEVVAEGIETEAQEAFLAARGCNEGQGYRYGRPTIAAEAGFVTALRTLGPTGL